MIDIFSYFFIGVGIVFWFWGTVPLLGKRSVLFKLHSLSVSDTLDRHIDDLRAIFSKHYLRLELVSFDL